jgi:hypothetical protein
VKRRYKIGDWFRVPLPGAHDAVGIITHACRSRLFGYFFSVAATHVPAFDEVKRWHASDAVACALFGGAGLEEARWSSIATSLAFDPTAWPFPRFVSRGAFGRTWSRITYDPLTMSVVQRERVPPSQVTDVPDARFMTPEELENFLQSRIAGETPDTPLVVCEVRSPIDFAGLDAFLLRGGRIQFSEPLDAADMQRLAKFVEAHPQCELRVHGLPTFDLRELRAFIHLRSLVLDVEPLQHSEELQKLRNLESLRVGVTYEAMNFNALAQLPELHRLELRGRSADINAVSGLKKLDTLVLVDTPPMDFTRSQSAPRLRSLSVAHVQWPLHGLAALPLLERLTLKDLQLFALPDLSRNTSLHAVELRNITALADLTPLAAISSLRELRIEGMPQLNVSNFRPLVACPALQTIRVDVGSKTKSREIYRLFAARTAG